MEAIFDIFKIFGHIFNFYMKGIQFLVDIIIPNQGWVDFITIYISVFIPVLALFSILVRKEMKIVFFNITIHIYCFLMTIPIVFISEEGLNYIVNGVFQKNINGAFLFWFFAVYNILNLFNRVFIIETAGKRVVDYKNKEAQKFYKSRHSDKNKKFMK